MILRMKTNHLIQSIFIILISGYLTSCANRDGLPSNFRSFNANSIPNAVPKVEARSRYGNPDSYTVLGKTYHVLKSAKCYHVKGIASWYGTKFHGRLTSSREPYSMYKMTAANKVLPLPTYVRVHNLENGKTIIVKVNDRGPFHENRVIDLSFAAAKKIDMTKKGTALVEVTAIDPRHPNQNCGYNTTSNATQPEHPKIYLQLGAFAERVNADKLLRKTQRLTQQTVTIVRISHHDKEFYKVRIGPVKDAEMADKIASKLKTEGIGKAFVKIGS